MTNCKQQYPLFPRLNYSGMDIFEEEQDHHLPRQQGKFQENTYPGNQKELMLPMDDLFEQNLSSQRQRVPKKSSNHNFQKHAVTTIKKLLRMRYNRQGSDAQKLAHEMWNIFLASGVKSKKILVVLFGRANFSQDSYRLLLNKCGFNQILQYDEEIVRSSQRILRERFVETVNEEAVRQNVANCRNIKMRQEFIAYFMELAHMIQEGPLIKMRINDRTAKKIQDDIRRLMNE